MTAAAAPPDEEVIWSFPVTKGIFKKTVVQERQITNYRVIQGSGYIGLHLLDDIVVMNQHRVSDSSYTSVGGGRYSPRIGTGSSTSRTVGDVVFIHEGKPFITFYQIPDPQGVARLAKAARKRRLENIKTAEKMNKARLQEQQQQQQQKDRATRTTISSDKVITCPRCSSANAQGSKYCGNCGFRFADVAREEEEGATLNHRPPPSPSLASATTSSSSSLNQEAKKQDITIDDNNFVTCELPAYGVKINYPSHWLRVEQGLKPPLFVGFKSPRENPSDIFSESVCIGLRPVPNIKLEQYIQANINNLKTASPDCSIIESAPITVTGRQQAHKLVYDRNGKRTMHVVTIRENKVYQIVYVAELSKYDSYLPTVQKMIDSFEITVNKY